MPDNNQIDVVITGDSSGAEKSFQDMETNLKNLGQKFEDLSKKTEQETSKITKAFEEMGKKLSSIGTTLSLAITAPLAAIGYACAKTAMNVAESEDLFSVVFNDMADDVRRWSETVAKEMGLVASTVRRQSAVLFTMFDNMRMGKQASKEMAQGMTELAYDLATLYNLPVENVFDKLKSGLMGMPVPLRELGILLTEEEVKAYALRNGMIKLGEELSEQGKMVARLGMIYEQTKVAQGINVDLPDTAVSVLVRLQNRIESLCEQMGNNLTETIKDVGLYIEQLVMKLNELVAWFSQLDTWQRNVILGFATFVAGIGPALLIVGSLVESIMTLVTAFEVLKKSVAVTAIFTAMSGPIGLIVAALAALAAAIYVVYQNWDKVKSGLINIWNTLVNFIADNIGKIMLMFPMLTASFFVLYYAWSAIFSYLKGLWNQFTSFLDACVKIAKRILDSLCEALSKLVEATGKAIGNMMQILGGLVDKFIPDWAKSFYNQICSLGDKLTQKTAEIGNNIRKNLTIDNPGSIADFRKSEDSNTKPKIKNSGQFYDVPDMSHLSLSDDKEGKKNRRGDTAYQAARKNYETEMTRQESEAALAGEKYTLDQKLALYLKYLSQVKKSDAEFADYQKGLAELTIGAHKDASEMKKALLDKEIAENKLSRENQFKAEITLLEEEVELTLRGSKERVDAETRVISKKKEYADYLAQITQKERELNTQTATDAISIQLKKYQSMYDMGLIGQRQLLGLETILEGERYKIELDGLEKSLEANAVNGERQLALYKEYLNAKTDAERDALRQLLADNSQNADDLMSILSSLQTAWTQYTKTRMDLSGKLRQEEMKNVVELKNSMTDAISQGLQDILTRTKSFSQAIRSIITSTINTVMKQITDAFAKSATDKAFAKIFKKMKSAEDAAEQESQNIRTAINQAGNNARLASDITTTNTVIGVKQAAANTEIEVAVTKDATIVASSQTAAQSAIASIQATMQALLAMLPMMLLFGAISGFGGGDKTSTSSSSVNLGRNPDSYYKTPNYLSLPSFDVGSWSVPYEMMAIVHPEELIVPAKGGMADNVRAMLSGNSGQGSFGGDSKEEVHLHVHPTYNAPTEKSMKKLIDNHTRDIANNLAKLQRNYFRPK